jgi:hypothetical protein
VVLPSASAWPIFHGRQDGHQQAEIGPKPGHYRFLLASVLERLSHPWIFPGIGGGSVDRFLFGVPKKILCVKAQRLMDPSAGSSYKRNVAADAGHRLLIRWTKTVVTGEGIPSPETLKRESSSLP